MNIIETVQKNLGFNELIKIDPNTQKVKGDEVGMGNNALAQAGIPAIMLGILNKLEQKPDLSLLDADISGSCLERIFGKTKDGVISRISSFTKTDDKHNPQQLEHIASESMRVIKENIGDRADATAVSNFVGKNKPTVLLYLPPELELGKLLQNNNLDDRTGKMEGPVSSFMHSVEKTFNSSN